MLVPRPLNYGMSDAVSMGGRRRNGGAPVSGLYGVHEAAGTLSSSFALRNHAWVLANAVSRRAAWVLVLRSLNYGVSDVVSAHVAAKVSGTSALVLWCQLGRLPRMEHSAAIYRIVPSCWQTLSCREQRGCSCYLR